MNSQLRLQEDKISNQQQLQVRSPRLKPSPRLNYSNESNYQTEQREDSILDESSILKKIINKVKKEKYTVIFINKLRRNAGIIPRINYTKPKRNYKDIRIRTLQTLYHLVILAHYISLIFLLLITSWTATLQTFNTNYAEHHYIITIKIVCLGFMILQIIGNFGSFLIKENNFKKCSMEIFKEEIIHYNFLINFLKAVMLVLIIVFPHNYAVSGVFFFLLAVNMIRGVSQIAHLEAAYIHTQNRDMIWKVGRVLWVNILIVQIMATVLMAMVHINIDNNWFMKFELFQMEWVSQYITSFYWSTIIATTIGFGDISPSNEYQKLIVSFLALVSCILLTYNISIFTQAFGNLKDKYESVNNKTVMFRRMIRRDYKNNVEISFKLKRKIYRFINSLSEDTKQLQFLERRQFLDSLPESLKHQYYKNTNKQLFSTVRFFNLLTHQTLINFSEKFKIIFMQPFDQFLTMQTQIRILEQGNIGFTYQRKGSSENGKIFDSLKIKKRESIGLLNSNFLTLEQLPLCGMKAIEFSVVWQISLQNFYNIIKSSRYDFEFFFNILHHYSYDENEWDTILCRRCSPLGHKVFHNSFKCPNLTYIPLKKRIFQKSFINLEICQNRRKFNRKKKKGALKSVLKYWKKYIKDKDNSDSRQVNYVRPVRMSSLVFFDEKRPSMQNQRKRKNSKNFYNHYFLDKQLEQIVELEKQTSFQVDIMFNFEFYMPKFNPKNLIMTKVEKKQDNQSSVHPGLQHVQHMKRKFTKQKAYSQ